MRMVKFQRTYVSGLFFLSYHPIILEHVYLWKHGSALWLLLIHWLNAALTPRSIGIDIRPTYHFRKQCDPSSTGLHNFCFPYLIWTPGVLTRSLMWSQCLVKTMAKLERNSIGTELWPWCVTRLRLQRSVWPTHCTSGLLTQSTSRIFIQDRSCLCHRWVFYTVWLVPDSYCASTYSTRVIALSATVLWRAVILMDWVLDWGLSDLLCLVSLYGADLWLKKPTAELKWGRSLLSVFHIGECFLILS